MTVKPLADFHNYVKGPDGHSSMCKACIAISRKRSRAGFTWNISAKKEAHFWSKTAAGPNGCIEWQPKSRDKDGYGFFFVNGRQLGAHRISWSLAGNVVPEWPDVIDHICKNIICVNPSHLRVVRQHDNVNKYADRSQTGTKMKAYWATLSAEQRSQLARDRWTRRRAKQKSPA